MLGIRYFSIKELRDDSVNEQRQSNISSIFLLRIIFSPNMDESADKYSGDEP